MKKHIILFIFLSCVFIKCDNRSGKNNYPDFKIDPKIRAIGQDPNKAIEIYTKAIIENPNDAEAYKNRSTAKFILSDHKGAFDDLSKSIEIKPTIDNFILKFFYRKFLGDSARKILDFDEALKIYPNNSSFLLFRGVEKQRMKDFQGAISDFSKIIEIDSTEVDFAYYNRGMAKVALFQKESACSDFRKAMQLGVAEANDAIKKYCK